MMRQDGTTARKAGKRRVPEWRLNKRTFEVPYLMKLGNIGRQEALALIARHNGDRDEITAELFSRRGRSH
ncbi:hypothetical protein [Mesorhizobium sangaii]|uniref:DUF3606 domain-containing protein n=1 Tax=Mesorhizobium sangaii TaxID=505389 RepID=A0A841PQR0_9HYPH|nr:hypothetical protein [Mesorhizobium sangaii]MBB6412960.1 hypothetical protein [Mesorhizobium sangaii]